MVNKAFKTEASAKAIFAIAKFLRTHYFSHHIKEKMNTADVFKTNAKRESRPPFCTYSSNETYLKVLQAHSYEPSH
jgi:hypothetical protein